MKLSKSQAHYIKAVYELSSGYGDGARVCDVAEKLNVSKASASLALTRLTEQGLIYKDTERHAHLTECGERKAIQILDKYEIIKAFLVKILCVDKSIADHDACAIEHVVSVDTFCAICRFSNKSRCAKDCLIFHTPDH